MEQEFVVDNCKMPPYNDAWLQLLDMGFGESQAQLAIVNTNGDIERAVEYLLNGGNDNDNDGDNNNENNNNNNGIWQRAEIEERKATSHRHHHHHSGKGHHHHNHGGASSIEALEDPYIPTFPKYEPSALRDTFQTYPTIGSGVTVDRHNSEIDSMATVTSGILEPQAVEKNSPTEKAVPSHHMVNTKDPRKDMDVLGCRGCCNYPNGKMGIAAVCVSVIGFILATFGMYTCKFFKMEMTDSAYSSNVYFGLFSIDGAEGCVRYDDAFKELVSGGPFKFARAMAILATVFGTLALVATLSLSCMSIPNLILKIVSIFYLISALCVILTLVVKTECDEDILEAPCKLASGAVLAIVAPFLYVVSSIIFYKIPLYESDSSVNGFKPTRDEQAPGKSVTIEEPPRLITVPSGSRRVEREYVDETGLLVKEDIVSRSDRYQTHHADKYQPRHLPRHSPPIQQESC